MATTYGSSAAPTPGNEHALHTNNNPSIGDSSTQPLAANHRAIQREDSINSMSQASSSAAGGSGASSLNRADSSGGLAGSFTSSTLADHAASNILGYQISGIGSANGLPELAGRASAAPSTVGTSTEAMMSSAGQMLISSIINRIVEKLPNSSGWRLTTLENDEMIRTTVANLVGLSEYQLPMIMKDILYHLEMLNRAAQQVAEESISGIDLLASQLFLLKVLVSCLFHQWSCISKKAGADPKAASKGWDDPPALEDTLAKHALSTMSIYLKLAVAREEGGMFTNTPSSAESERSFDTGKTTAGNGSVGGRTGDRALAGLSRDALKSFASSKPAKEKERDAHRDQDADARDGDKDGERAADAWTPGCLLLDGGSSLFSIMSCFPPTRTPFGGADSGLGGDGLPEFHRDWFSMLLPSRTTAQAVELGETDDVVSLMRGIYRHTSMVIFYLSSSNWAVVSARIRNRLAYLSTTIEDNPNTAELRLLECSNINRGRLSNVVAELGTTFLHLKRSAQQAIALSFRRAMWNWILYHPIEFAQMSASGRKLDGAPDVLFDQAYNISEASRRKVVFWPLLTALLILCPDIVGRAAIGEGRKGGSFGKKVQFLDTLRKSMRLSKIGDTAAFCCVDLVRAAAFTQRGDSGLRLLVPDLEADLREKVFGPIMNPSAFSPTKADEAALATDLLHAFFTLDPSRTTKELFVGFLSEGAPVGAQVVLVKACTRVSARIARLPWHPHLRLVYPQIARALRHRFKDAVFKLNRTSAGANYPSYMNGRPDRRPFSRGSSRISGSADAIQSHRLELVNSLLSLWFLEPDISAFGMADPGAQVGNTGQKVVFNDAFLMELVKLDSQLSLQWSITYCVHAHGLEATAYLAWKASLYPMFKLPDDATDLPFDPFTVHAQQILAPTVFRSIYERIIWSESPAGIKFHTGVARPGLRAAKRFWNLIKQTTNFTKASFATPDADRSADDATAQIAILLTLCSPDPGACAAGMQMGRDFAALHDSLPQPYSPQRPTDEWKAFFAKLEEGSSAAIGRIAQQKRLRSLLRSMKNTSPAALAAWKEAYKRWATLTQVVARPVAADTSDTAQEKAAYWHNLSGFLSALGGACAIEDTEALTTSLQQTYVNPKLINPDPPVPMIESFMQEMVDLLVSDSIWVREKVKETLGTDLSPRLTGILLRQIHAVLSDFFDKSTGLPRPADMFTVFVEQSISVVQMVLRQLTNHHETTLGVDIGSLMVLYVEYVNSLGRKDQALRIKISMCQLCEALMEQKSSFLFTNELRVRNRLFQALVTWTSDSAEDTQVNERAERLQKELDVVCLKTIATLLDRLPLILADDALLLDDKVEWAKSRQFSMYFNYFLKVLNRTRSMPSQQSIRAIARGEPRTREPSQDLSTIRDSAILALSNLLASNIDSGLQHSLPLAYKDDPRIRTAFMQIMTNVLIQGTQFEDLERITTRQQPNRLIELVCEGDMQLALSICQICRGFDAESLDFVLLNILDSRGELMRFLSLALEEEIDRTPSEEMVFRSNSFRTHLLSVYAKMHGYEYLRTTLGPLINDLNSRTKTQSFEIDPQRLEPGESVASNQALLEELAQSFIDAICTSAHRVPKVLRELCRQIRVLMDAKFPNSRYQGVGGFMFLRFISPAVVAPQLIDLNSGGPNKEARRGLLLVSKILQTLASNNLFPTHKEPFMTNLNDFLKRNVWKVTNFLDQVSDARTEQDRSAAPQHSLFSLGYSINDADSGTLHKFLYDNVDRIGKDLLSRSATLRSKGDLVASEHAKRIYEDLCVALAEVGEYSADVPSAFYQQKTGDARLAYQEFTRRHAGRHFDPDAFSTTFKVGPPSKAGRSVLYYNCASVRAAVIDFEALIFYVMQVLQPFTNKEYDFVIDATGMSSENWIPPQWLLYCRSLIPPEIGSGLRAIYVLNVNNSLKECVRPYLVNDAEKGSSGSQMSEAFAAHNIIFCSSLAELEVYIPRRDFALNSTTMVIASEPQEQIFPSATLVRHYRALTPVAFRLGNQHLQITALKAQEIFGGRMARTNEIIHFADIDDVRPVSHRGDETAFLLTSKGGRSSFLFHSKDRTEIVQALRQAKARVGRMAYSKTERTLMPSDVPGTLLNMALSNMTSSDYMLRASAYDLLCALSTSFNFGASNARRRLLSVKGLALPANTTAFVCDLSKDFATAAPGVSLEFLISFFEGFEAASPRQRAACLQYMVPWLSNLAIFTHTAREQRGEYSKRIKEILGHLIKITVQQPEIYATMQRNIWAHISKLDDLLPVLLEVFIEAAIDSGVNTPAFEAVLDTMVSFSSINLRGKLLSRLRRAIAKTAQAPSSTQQLDSPAWLEIATLVRMNMVLTFTNRLEVMLYLPEMLHILLLLAGTGSEALRRAIYGSAINLMHSLCTDDPREAKQEADAGAPQNISKLRALLATFASDQSYQNFGLPASDSTPFGGALDVVLPSPTNQEVEKLASQLYQVVDFAAPSIDTANSWRARLTSLVTSTAFQYNPFIQSRAFVLLGCLAQGEIDDDLLYQILVSLRGSISEWGNNGNDGPLTSILACLSKVVKILPRRSRYLPQMFWLGVCMVQYGHVPIFRAGVDLIHSALQTIWDRELPREVGLSMPDFLLEARAEFREASCRLDDETGVDFDIDFGFALAALLVKGLRSEDTLEATKNVLYALLGYTSRDVDSENGPSNAKVSVHHLGFFVALLPTATSAEGFGQLLERAGMSEDVIAQAMERRKAGKWSIYTYFDAVDNKKALLVVTLMASLLEHASTDEEKLLLYTFLADAALAMPAIVSILYDWLSVGMQEVFARSTNRKVVQAVHAISSIAMRDPVFAAQATETARRGGPSAYLEESGYASLLDCGSFALILDQNRRILLARLSTALLAAIIDIGVQ